MIHLDTNLIIGVIDASDLHHPAARRVLSGPGPFAASAVAWMEFASVPLPSLALEAARHLLTAGIVPFGEEAALLAGQLFYETGASRRTRLDTMIAATAILAGAELATVNAEDFRPFVPHGLKLFDFR